MIDDFQYTNQFFEEGRSHFVIGGSVKDCPYDYLSAEQDDEKQVQNELYRQKEWLAGFHFQYRESLLEKNSA